MVSSASSSLKLVHWLELYVVASKFASKFLSELPPLLLAMMGLSWKRKPIFLSYIAFD